MQQVFVENKNVDNCFIIGGEDAFHLIKVVRIKPGEKVRVSTSQSSYICKVKDIDGESVILDIVCEDENTELSNKIYLFQAIPKGDRFEGIIEKCVELGVYEIIPVEMKNCVVRLDDKKKASRIKRYQAIADTAARQSKRSLQPIVKDVMNYKEALEYARANCTVKLLPYECAKGMTNTFEVLDSINKDDNIAVFVGPEGGFDSMEINLASDFEVISLGKRILRTDSAAICMASMLMLKSEELNL
ncbi:MAG: 16S rRNA (uracil(1498)-N(3))-methyltransferase [Pseudobutyrivibrio sp.]|nr:16S rRNA (uracil(1498)-N(3))-methyltransferase [Pseudobutyrivibrio sp.]